MVVPIQRNSETDEVSQGKCDSKDLDIMSHSADTKAWETLEHFDLELVRDPRSVCLGLSTDGFHPHSEASCPCSCQPVFIMPYNMPSNKCLKQGYVFLALVISGPKEPRK
jgi:hypothetical protein